MYYTLLYNYESQNNQILILLLSVLRAQNQFNFQNGGLKYIFWWLYGCLLSKDLYAVV